MTSFTSTMIKNSKYKEASAFLNRTLQKTRYSAVNVRNLSFNISLFDVMIKLDLQDYKCALTGWDLEFTRGGSFDGKNPRGCTIDRINNNIGYEPGNIQLVCCMPNLIRNKLSVYEFKQLCEAVSNYTPVEKVLQKKENDSFLSLFDIT